MTNNVWLLLLSGCWLSGCCLDTFCPFLRDFVYIPMCDLFGIQFFFGREILRVRSSRCRDFTIRTCSDLLLVPSMLHVARLHTLAMYPLRIALLRLLFNLVTPNLNLFVFVSENYSSRISLIFGLWLFLFRRPRDSTQYHWIEDSLSLAYRQKCCRR